MPLTTSGFMTRTSLLHPEDPPKLLPDANLTKCPPFERVLKFNPNHDATSGRFTSGSGGGGYRGTGSTAPAYQSGPSGYGRSSSFQPGDTPGKRFTPKASPASTRIQSGAFASRGSLRQTGSPQLDDLVGRPGRSPATVNDLVYRPAPKPTRAATYGARAPEVQNVGAPDPMKTIYTYDETITHTGKKGVVPQRAYHAGAFYDDDRTLVPYEKDSYIDKDTGEIYHTDRAEVAARRAKERANDAEKQAAYAKQPDVMAALERFGKKRR